MRHRVAHRKLGRTTPHRTALLRNLAASLIAKERIRTTVAKAKELRPFVEKLVTLGKKDSLHARRRALSILPRKDAVKKLFVSISPRFSERPGGYTRILKLAPRQGDGASMALIEFVDYRLETADSGPAADKSAKKKKSDQAKEEAKAATGAEAEPDEAGEKTAKKKSRPRKKASATK
ncbi:MAG TPA: 50S ribosomal protein L17 [Vicinamibacteria bacterium]|nr:50S ribosomal protein L17 [Vicinamibacteria bacterium]